MKIDYSSFSQSVTAQDLEAFSKSNKKSLVRPGSIIQTLLSTIFILVAVSGFVVEDDAFSSGMSSVILKALFGVVLIAAWIIFGKDKKQTAEDQIRFNRFVATNGAKLMSAERDPNYSGMIFNKGGNRLISEALLFPDGTEIGNYRYVTDVVISSHVYNWSYVRVKLSRRLPHMVLDARQNNHFTRKAIFESGFDRSQALQLEGDFNKFFTLYVPKEYERDALYVFTPDVMTAVIDAGQAYDIEVIDDELFIYGIGHRDLRTESGLVPMLNVVDKIRTELHDQTNYYADERVGDRTLNLIADTGQRLSKRVSMPTLIFLIILAWLSVLIVWWLLQRAMA